MAYENQDYYGRLGSMVTFLVYCPLGLWQAQHTEGLKCKVWLVAVPGPEPPPWGSQALLFLLSFI